MSKEQKGQLISFYCDNCDEEKQVASHNFVEAWESAKEDGWRCFKNDEGEWEHICPDCRS